MDLGRAFSYVFEDQDWIKKVGIAALAMIIPILGQIAVLGWGLEVTRRVIRQEAVPLPGWEDPTSHFMRGLQAFGIGLLYALPLILISGCLGTFSAIAANPDVVGDQAAGALSVVISMVSICLNCFTFIYSLLMQMMLAAAYAKMVDEGEFGAGLRFGEIFAMVRSATGPYLMVLLGGIATSFLAMIGMVACFVGILFTSALAMAINGHLYGQAYNAAKAAAPATM